VDPDLNETISLWWIKIGSLWINLPQAKFEALPRGCYLLEHTKEETPFVGPKAHHSSFDDDQLM